MLKRACKFNHIDNFAKKHTQAEWKALEDSGKLSAEIKATKKRYMTLQVIVETLVTSLLLSHFVV